MTFKKYLASFIVLLFFIILNVFLQRTISGFHREVAENCTLLGYYAESSGYFSPRIVGKKLLLLAA